MIERDEEHWYVPGWPDLRRELVKLCLRHADDLLEVLADPAAGDDRVGEACGAWFGAVARAAEALRGARPEATRWGHAMRLLVASEDLARALTTDRVLRRDGDEEDRRAALVVVLRRHLENQRRAAASDTPHRLATWERLDRISRGLVPVVAEPGQRCGEAHHRAVLEEIERRHAHDRNLPRRLPTIEAYFLEFCPECRTSDLDFEGFEDEESGNPEQNAIRSEGRRAGGSLDDDDLAFLLDEDLALLAEATGVTPDPLRCFRELPAEPAEAFAVVNKLQELLEGTDRFLNARAYAVRRSLSRRQIYKRVREATDLLIACLRRQLERDTRPS